MEAVLRMRRLKRRAVTSPRSHSCRWLYVSELEPRPITSLKLHTDPSATLSPFLHTRTVMGHTFHFSFPASASFSTRLCLRPFSPSKATLCSLQTALTGAAAKTSSVAGAAPGRSGCGPGGMDGCRGKVLDPGLREAVWKDTHGPARRVHVRALLGLYSLLHPAECNR